MLGGAEASVPPVDLPREEGRKRHSRPELGAEEQTGHSSGDERGGSDGDKIRESPAMESGPTVVSSEWWSSTSRESAQRERATGPTWRPSSVPGGSCTSHETAFPRLAEENQWQEDFLPQGYNNLEETVKERKAVGSVSSSVDSGLCLLFRYEVQRRIVCSVCILFLTRRPSSLARTCRFWLRRICHRGSYRWKSSPCTTALP